MSLRVPDRAGPRPTTSRGIPHRQLDQTPAPELYERLVATFVTLPDTRSGPSLISVPGARALFLDDRFPCNEHAFMTDREFAHVHPSSDGSFHMVLSPDDCAHALEQGWGELHPLANSGRIPPTVAMVYAPRDETEIDVVLDIARASLEYAKIG